MVVSKPADSFLRIAILILFSILQQDVFAQCVLQGRVIDSTKAPVPFATLALLNQKDSSVYKGSITDEKGNYCFSAIKTGKYLIKISVTGFATSFSPPLPVDSASTVTYPDITIHSQLKNLEEVSVTAIRDPIQFKNGNIIVNIDGSPLAVGSTAYELLLQLPGVSIQNDNITIDGNGGVKLMIDDRVQQFSGQQLINLLRSINSSGIDKIEILKNPPVKYDAAGTSGMINIKTKKLKITGFSGSVDYTLGQGTHTMHEAGLTLNYKGKKIALFTGITYSTGNLLFPDNLYKSVTYNSVTTVLDQKSAEHDWSSIPNYNAGMDWYIDKKNTLGLKLEGSYAKAVRIKPGTTQVSDNSLGYDELQFSRTVKNHWHYLNGNFNLEHLFDTSGTSLKFSTDFFSPFIDDYTGNYQNHFFNTAGSEILSPLEFKATNTLGTQILASKLDFERKLSKTLSLETGVKGSYQKITSDYALENKDNQTGIYSIDSTFTNKFFYKENIGAAYMSLSKELKKVNLQLGLRAENTAIQSESITNEFKYSKQYLNVFPNSSLDYKRSDNSVFQLSFNHRINRPNYSSFNPYREFLNILTSRTGNPYLSPTFSSAINLTHIYKRKITNSLIYRRVNKPFVDLVTQNDSTKESVFTIGNLKLSHIIGYSLFFRTDIKKWWSVMLNGVVYYLDYTGKVNGLDYNTSVPVTYRIFTNQSFLLPKKVKIELSVLYDGPRLSEINHYKSRYVVNIAMNKTMVKDKLIVTIGMEDIFRTSAFEYYVDLPDQHWSNYQYYDMRRLKIGLSYNFGNVKVEQREINAADTEQQRMGH